MTRPLDREESSTFRDVCRETSRARCCQATRVSETTRGRAEHVLVRCQTRSSNTGKQFGGERASGRALGAPTANALRMHLSAKRRGVVRHRRDETRIRRAKPLVNRVREPRAKRCGRRAIRRRGQRPSRKSLLVRCAEAPSRPEGPRDTGRSEAQRLVRRRAQRHAVTRDGQQVGAARADPETCRRGGPQAM
jgi:hypothetical protein